MAPIWLVGGVILLASGFGAALVPWLRARQRSRRIAWSTARAAIDSAAITRDAARDHHPEAEQLLARAEALAAAGGGPAAARNAAAYARRADRLWRETSGG